mmetsp:Transcript_91839/g.183008  ORF Transcript_91839/g.183008 Transcript_91839/m.183008 type:complete len:347 (-) Transcript_91839:167-1207(-)
MNSFLALVNNQVEHLQLKNRAGDVFVLNRVTIISDVERMDLSLAYCGTNLVFEIECCPQGIDITPISTGGVEDAYSVFSLESIPVMKTWAPQDTNGLDMLATQIRESFSAFQRKLLEGPSVDQRISFNYDAIKRCPTQEGRVDHLGVHFRFPLFESTDDERLSQIKVHVRIPCEVEGNADVSVLIDPVAMSVTSSIVPPPWDIARESLFDYLPSLQALIRNGFSQRKHFVEALSASRSMLEYDSSDFSKAVVLAKCKSAKSKAFRLLVFELSHGFPTVPPSMTLFDFTGSKYFKLDPILYRYSPRWEPSRMADELFQHALMNQQAWEPVAASASAAPQDRGSLPVE